MAVKRRDYCCLSLITGLGFILSAPTFAEQEVIYAEKNWQTKLDTITDRLLPAPDGGIYTIGSFRCRPSMISNDTRKRCGIHGHTVSKTGQVSQWGVHGSWGLHIAGIVLTGDGRLLFPAISYTDDEKNGYIGLYQAYPGNNFQPERIFSSPILTSKQLLEFTLGKGNVVYSKDFNRAYLSLPDSSGQVTLVALALNNKMDNVLWQTPLSVQDDFERHNNLSLSEYEGKLLHHTSGAMAILNVRDGSVIRSDDSQPVAGKRTPASLLAMPQDSVLRWNVDENGTGVLNKIMPFSETIVDPGFPSVSFPANTSDTSIKFWGGLTSDPQKNLAYLMLTQQVVAYDRDSGKVNFEIIPEKADFHFFNLGKAADISFDSATGWGYFAYHNTKIGYKTWEEGLIGFSADGQRKKIVFPDSGIRHSVGNSLLAEFDLPPLIHDGVMYTFYSDTLSAWP
ncbi:hypothetical protein, partial [Enterobacter bugandensis]